MNIVYYTSGTTGSGRIIRGIAIGNALKRANIDCEYTIVHSSDFPRLITDSGFKQRLIPIESDEELSEDSFKNSILFNTLNELSTDILIVDLMWFTLAEFIDTLQCKKIFLCVNQHYYFFSIKLPTGKLEFNPKQYDLLLKIEPFDSPYVMEEINPLIMLNPDEILSKDDACKSLGLDPGKNNALIAVNGKPGEFEEIRDSYKHLADKGYHITTSSNHHGGLFPAVNYLNAFDLIVTGGGYSSFWETRFLNKKAIYVPSERRFENITDRINLYSDYTFQTNGADQLAGIINDMCSKKTNPIIF